MFFISKTNEKTAVNYGSLPTVSLAKLIDVDAGTVNELTSACRDIGLLLGPAQCMDK
jgi:hypothetical protein